MNSIVNWKKYLKQNKTKIIKIDDKSKQINVLDSSTDILKDDKPKPINSLDLNTDISNIIGNFVKKRSKKGKRRNRRNTKFRTNNKWKNNYVS